MAKILITESVHPIGPELLTAAGHTVVYANRDMDVIRREIVDADAVLVRIIELPGSLLATAKNLKIVSKHGVGYDNIDLDYCKSHGIAVTITPNANSLSVAEHAFTLMLTLAKNIIPVSNEYRTVGFAAKNHAPGIEMTGKTLGLIGMGRIGKHILHMCRDGLDMHVIVYDPYISEVPEGVERVDDLSELLRRADVRLPSLLGSILGSSHGGSMLLAGRAQRSMPVLYVLGDRLAAMPHGLQGLQPFGLSDKPLSIEGNISLPPRRNPAARSYRLHIDPRYLDPRR